MKVSFLFVESSFRRERNNNNNNVVVLVATATLASSRGDSLRDGGTKVRLK